MVFKGISLLHLEGEEFEEDIMLEHRGQFIKNLLQSLAHNTIKEEEEESYIKRIERKIKKDKLTDMDYKIMSIYNAPLPNVKQLKKKKTLGNE